MVKIVLFYTKAELIQAMKSWKDELAKFDQTSLKNTPEARQAFKSNLDKLSEQLSASEANAQEVLKTAAALQTILDKEEIMAQMIRQHQISQKNQTMTRLWQV